MTTEDPKTYRVVSLEVENFKRVEFVRLEPEPDEITVIGGPNRSGKTSTLDALEVLFGGKAAIPAEPIHRGARRTRIKGELASGEVVDLHIEVEVNANGSAKLTVLDEHRNPIPKPQTFLNGLFSKVSFDPLAFARAGAKEQDETLKRLIGLDFSDIAARRQAAYECRTGWNRKAKELDARLGAMQRHQGVPAEEVSVKELLAEFSRREAIADEKADLNRFAAELASDLSESESLRESTKARIAALEAELLAVRNRLAEVEGDITRITQDKTDAELRAREFEVPPVDEVKAQIEASQETNRKVRENAERTALQKELDAANDEVRSLSDAIIDADEEQAARIAGAKFPVAGLGFDECGVTYHGIPFGQASHSDRITVSAAIGAALHPALKVLLIRDGEKIGSQDMATIRSIARDKQFQVFLERFTESGEGCNVVLDEGRVRAPAAAE